MTQGFTMSVKQDDKQAVFCSFLAPVKTVSSLKKQTRLYSGWPENLSMNVGYESPFCLLCASWKEIWFSSCTQSSNAM